MTDDEDPTFDLELPDATAEEFALLLSGLSVQMLRYAQLGAEAPVERCDGLLNDLFVENREAARYMFLEADTSEYLVAASLPDETLEALEIELVNGEAYDARGDYEDIEVE